uniref:Uncharacterized protein n=1 Tax=Ixodes ricinus TaxID=34613 RepID=A0A0K8R8T5_IXORI
MVTYYLWCSYTSDGHFIAYFILVVVCFFINTRTTSVRFLLDSSFFDHSIESQPKCLTTSCSHLLFFFFYEQH